MLRSPGVTPGIVGTLRAKFKGLHSCIRGRDRFSATARSESGFSTPPRFRSNSKSVIRTVVHLSFFWAWNDFPWPLVDAKDRAFWTLQPGLSDRWYIRVRGFLDMASAAPTMGIFSR